MKWIGIVLAVFGVQLVWADAALVDFELKRIFPAEIAGLKCDKVEKYNDAFGYSLFYSDGANFFLELSVYDLEMDSVGQGHTVPGISKVLAYEESKLKKQQESGEIDKLKKRGSSVVPPKGKTQFSNVVFQYATEAEVNGALKTVSRLHSIYATAAHDNFFVAVLDFDATKGKEAKTALAELVKQLTAVIEGAPGDQEVLLAACDVAINDPASYGGQVSAQYVFNVAQTQGNLEVYDGLFAWPDGYRKPKNVELLMAAYFAGMLKVVVPENLESGGAEEAFHAMLSAYETMRSNDQIRSISKFDEWLKVEEPAARYKQALIDCEYLAP